jgi:hypothetical protein
MGINMLGLISGLSIKQGLPETLCSKGIEEPAVKKSQHEAYIR